VHDFFSNFTPMPKLSVVIITFNEEQVLEATLKAISWADEIVVLDSGSTDSTCQIAEKYGAKVFHAGFKGFGLQKQRATALASHDWVFNIDADEVVSQELQQSIQELIKTEPSHRAYFVKRTLVFLGKKFKYGRESSERYIRLFDRKVCGFDAATVHEQVIFKGKPGELKGFLLHYSYKDLEQYLSKLNSYTSKAAAELYLKGKRKSATLSLIFFPIYFFKHLFISGNVLNGYSGWLWSFLSAGYPILKYAKLKQLIDAQDKSTGKSLRD
jgi:glycosyltransferase involved in cell wall biosynthesis